MKNTLIYSFINFRVNKLSSETAELEKEQQRSINETLTKLKQCVILNEEDEVVDEFPSLTDKQLQIVRFALQGSRGEVIMINLLF